MPPGVKHALATLDRAGGPVATGDATFGLVKAQNRVDELYSPEYFGGLEQLANAAASSRLFGESSREQLFMVLMTGRELGIAPTVALRNIGVFKGKTVISSQLQLAKVKEAGYKAEILENTAEKATVRLTAPNGVVYEKSFTMEDARLAGLPQRNALYGTIPATMLLNRAIGLVCRYGAPEVMNGLYNETELDELDEPGDLPQGGPVQGVTTYTADAVVNGWDIPAQEEFVTLMDTVHRKFKETGHGDDYLAFQEKWLANKAKDPASVVLPALRSRVERLNNPAPAPVPAPAPAPASGPVTPPAPAPKPPIPEPPAAPAGWSEDDLMAFEDLVSDLRALSTEAGEDESEGQHRVAYYLKQRDTIPNPASVLDKMQGSKTKLEKAVAKKKAEKSAPPPPPVQPPLEPEVVTGEMAYLRMDPDKRSTLMTNLWQTINSRLAAQGIKGAKATKECQRLFGEWTKGTNEEDQAAVEAAVILGQEAWLEGR